MIYPSIHFNILQYIRRHKFVDSRGSNVGTVQLTFTLPSTVASSFFSSLHSLGPNVLPVAGFPRWDRDQGASQGILLRRLLSVVVAEGSNGHVRMSTTRY
jgi:hypothetical protein